MHEKCYERFSILDSRVCECFHLQSHESFACSTTMMLLRNGYADRFPCAQPLAGGRVPPISDLLPARNGTDSVSGRVIPRIVYSRPCRIRVKCFKHVIYKGLFSRRRGPGNPSPRSASAGHMVGERRSYQGVTDRARRPFEVWIRHHQSRHQTCNDQPPSTRLTAD